MQLFIPCEMTKKKNSSIGDSCSDSYLPSKNDKFYFEKWRITCHPTGSHSHRRGSSGTIVRFHAPFPFDSFAAEPIYVKNSLIHPAQVYSPFRSQQTIFTFRINGSHVFRPMASTWVRESWRQCCRQHFSEKCEIIFRESVPYYVKHFTFPPLLVASSLSVPIPVWRCYYGLTFMEHCVFGSR